MAPALLPSGRPPASRRSIGPELCRRTGRLCPAVDQALKSVPRPKVKVEEQPLLPTPALPSSDILGTTRRGGTTQGYTVEPTLSGNPLSGAVSEVKAAKQIIESRAVPPPASHGPAASLPTKPQHRETTGGPGRSG